MRTDIPHQSDGSGRARFNLSLSPALWADVRHIVEAYGFRNVQQLVTVALRQLVAANRRGEMRRCREKVERGETIEAEEAGAYIARMFDELSEAEPTPQTADRFRRRHRRECL